MGRRWEHVHCFLLIAAITYATIANVYLAFHLTCGDCLPPIALANHVAHFLLAPAIILLPLSVLLRAPRWLWLYLLPATLAFAVWYGPNWLPHPSPDPDGIAFTAVTFNVWGFRADPDQTFAVIESQDADLVGLQELRPILQGKLRDELAERYPFQVSEVLQGSEGLALLSRFPILDSTVVIQPYDTTTDTPDPNYLRAVVDIGRQSVVIYVFHPAIPEFTIPTRYNDHRMHHQIQVITGMVAAETGPVLMLCDCNSTPRSRQYALFDQVFDGEAFRQRGWGFGLTHPDNRPIMRLDYVWFSDEIRALEAKVWLESGTSDHRPLWAQLDLHGD